MHRWRLGLLIGTMGAGVALAGAGPVAGFRDATAALGTSWRNVNGTADQIPLLDQNGQGIAVLDYDEDGFFDLFLVNGSTLPDLTAGRPPAPCALLRNRGDGTFVEVTAPSGVSSPRWAIGAAAADVDQDGFTDLHVTAYGPDYLLHNQGDGTFELVDDAWGANDPGWSSAASYGDVDGDGDLDLAIGNYVVFDPAKIPDTDSDGGPCLYKGLVTGCGPWRWRGQGLELYRNEGGRFVRVTEEAGLAAHAGARCFQPLLIDLDGDQDLDLYVGTDVMPNICLENRGDGTFVTNPSWGGTHGADGKQRSSMGLAAGDVDGDGRPDLFMTNFADEDDTFFVNRASPGSLRLEDVTTTAGLGTHRGELGWGAALADLDLDGHLDVFLVNGHIYPQVEGFHDPLDSYPQLPRCYRGDGKGRFVEAHQAELASFRASARALAVLDRENDGDLDLVIGVHNGKPRLVENTRAESIEERRGILVDLVGTSSNRDGLGAHLVVEQAGQDQHRWSIPHQGFQGTQDGRQHFSVPRGGATLLLRIRWPSGKLETRRLDAAGTVMRFVEP